MADPNRSAMPGVAVAVKTMEDVQQLIEEQQQLLEGRLARLTKLQSQLSKRATRLLRWALGAKVTIIILSAVVATRVVADGLWPLNPDGTGSMLAVVVVFTVLAVVLAIVGGLNGAFKPGEVATEIHSIAVGCRTAVHDAQREWGRKVQQLGVCESALQNAYPLLERLDSQLERTESQVGHLGISVPDAE